MEALTAGVRLDVAKDVLRGIPESTPEQGGGGGWGPPNPTSGSPSLDLEQPNQTAHEFFKPNGR
jgi:hypothetical protein